MLDAIWLFATRCNDGGPSFDRCPSAHGFDVMGIVWITALIVVGAGYVWFARRARGRDDDSPFPSQPNPTSRWRSAGAAVVSALVRWVSRTR